MVKPSILFSLTCPSTVCAQRLPEVDSCLCFGCVTDTTAIPQWLYMIDYFDAPRAPRVR
jgi:hypothetical protein